MPISETIPAPTTEKSTSNDTSASSTTEADETEPVKHSSAYIKYEGIDGDNDGFGDTPFMVYWVDYGDRNITCYDNHPLMEPTVIPEFPSWIPLAIMLIAFPVSDSFPQLLHRQGAPLFKKAPYAPEFPRGGSRQMESIDQNAQHDSKLQLPQTDFQILSRR